MHCQPKCINSCFQGQFVAPFTVLSHSPYITVNVLQNKDNKRTVLLTLLVTTCLTYKFFFTVSQCLICFTTTLCLTITCCHITAVCCCLCHITTVCCCLCHIAALPLSVSLPQSHEHHSFHLFVCQEEAIVVFMYKHVFADYPAPIAVRHRTNTKKK